MAVDQTIIEVETEKATIPVPANMAGKVEAVRVRMGQKVSTGTLGGSHRGGCDGASTKPVGVPTAKAKTADGSPTPPPPPNPKTLTGSRNRLRRSRRLRTRAVSAKSVPHSGWAGHAAPGPRVGVDLGRVTGTAPGGRVTLDDVKAYVHGLPKETHATVSTGAPLETLTIPPLPDFSKYGPIEKKPFSSLRKAIAKNLTLSWHIAPQHGT